MRKYFTPSLLILSSALAFGTLVNKKYNFKQSTNIAATENKTVATRTSTSNKTLNTTTITCIANGFWDAPTTWSGGSVPTINDNVVIDANFTVKLVNRCVAKEIEVRGTLTSNNATGFNLTTGQIEIVSGGALQLGSETSRYTANGSITLTGSDPTIDTKKIMVMSGGRLDLHGEEKLSWTQLSSTAPNGATSIQLKEPVTGWEVGDSIVIASSDRFQQHSETRVITSFGSNNTVNFVKPLTYLHYGLQNSYDNGLAGPANRTWTIDMRTEVANLNRNIKIRGDAFSETDGFGGYVMAMMGSTCKVEQVELFRMGQKRKIARYPLHFHLMGDGGTGQYFKNCAIVRSFNRAIVVHGTNNSLVEGNVAYNIFGSAYFLEDGVEVNNTFRRNFGTNIYKPPHAPTTGDSDQAFVPVPNLLSTYGIVPSDFKQDGIRVISPAVFWITNPSNIIEDNVAAGSEGVGFWYGLPEKPTGLSSGTPNVNPRLIPLLSFKGNRAHSVFTGLHIDHSHTSDQNALETSPYTPEINGVMTTVVFSDFTCYKMRRAVWHRTSGTLSGAYIKLDNMKFADIEGAEMLVSSWHGFIENSVMVGKTPNSTFTVPEEGSNNFSAISFYDGWNAVKGCHFENFDDPQYGSVFSYFGGAIDRSNDWFENCTFKNVNYYNDEFNIRSNQISGAIRDVNGTVNGIPNSSIVLGHPYLIDDVNFEKIQPNYAGYQSNKEAHVCKVDFGSSLNTSVSMYSEWGDGHAIHGSTWGGSNQFAVIPNLGRIYKFRFLDDIADRSGFRFLYGKNNDKLDIIIQGSPVKLLVPTIANESGSITAVRNSMTNAYYWDATEKELHIRLFAKNDVDPTDQEYNARSNITIATFDNLPHQAERVFSSSRPYNASMNVANKFIEAENYDYGGQFMAYLEMGSDAPNPASDLSTTPMIKNTYRVGEIAYERVDPAFSNNIAIRDIVSGEYFNYTIKVPTTGNYKFIANLDARSTTTTCTLKVDGVLVDTIQFNTEASKLKKYVITELKNLIAGDRTITVSFSNVRNFDNFSLTNATSDTDKDGMLDYDEMLLCRNPENANDFGIDFNLDNESAANWTVSNITNFSIANGIVSGQTTSLPSRFFNSQRYNFKTDINTVPTIKIRMKASASTPVRLYWENEDGGFSSARSLAVNYTSVGNWQELSFPLNTVTDWMGKTIKSIMVQPANTANVSFEIDWLRSSGYTDCQTNPVSMGVPPNFLPVELISFIGKNTDSGVKLSWETASEKNNQRFDILHSTDKNYFQVISSVAGKGNSSSTNKYNYLDIQPSTGENYYKLNQVDFDGKVTSFNTIAVNTPQSNNTFTAYAGDSNLQLTINSIKSGKATVELYNISGSKIATKSIDLVSGLNSNTMWVTNFQKGVYVVVLILHNQTLIQKIVK
ncbi:T9SS type A sorting domain-containing protein [Pelobium sp.]|nr:G8 domain-containing protein [Pelobium sp.]MDA9555385.1 T9SS type A sorting domain-containing protein [Pelobium sp.]